MLTLIIQHDQLWWRIEQILDFNGGELTLLFFNETNNFRIENQFPHANLYYCTRVGNLQQFK